MAKNLNAKLASQYERLPNDDIDRQNALLEDALALMVRERLTGAKPPRGANGIVDAWREWIDEKAGPILQRMEGAIDDQAAFGKLMRDVLVALALMEGPLENAQQDDKAEADEKEDASGQGSEEEKEDKAEPSEAENEEAEGSKAIRKATPHRWWRKSTRPANRTARSSPTVRPGVRIRPCSKTRRISAIRSLRDSMMSS